MMPRRHRSRGFTLIEAMAAIVVMAIVIPVLLEGFNLAADLAKVTLRTADATMLAQSTMDELISTGNWQNASTDEQQVGKYTYNIEVTTDSWDNEIDITQVIVRVHWTDRGERNVTLTTLVYYPDLTAPENQGTLP
jgi:prepilin-type N-terminal cleavage/methylation domain-containing protein